MQQSTLGLLSAFQPDFVIPTVKNSIWASVPTRNFWLLIPFLQLCTSCKQYAVQGSFVLLHRIPSTWCCQQPHKGAVVLLYRRLSGWCYQQPHQGASNQQRMGNLSVQCSRRCFSKNYRSRDARKMRDNISTSNREHGCWPLDGCSQPLFDAATFLTVC